MAAWHFEDRAPSRIENVALIAARKFGEPPAASRERKFIELMTSDRKLKAYREGSK